MARSVAENNSRQLWKEVRQLKKNSKSCVTKCMDKKTECENIAELFSEKYSELYNSVSYETDQLATITNNNMKDITMYCMINARTCNDSDNIVHTHQGRMPDFSRGGGPTLKFLGFWIYMPRS